ncbi:MAG: VCBS repeat-containing protein [Candidatus Sedimenticola sp. (ex Thyasira tokunagai)]
MAISKWLLPLLCLLPSYVTQAQSTPGFSTMEVVKLNSSTRELIVLDLDSDGLQDLALLNNNQAGIQLLRQYAPNEPRNGGKLATRNGRWKPVFDDSRFGKQRLATGLRMYSLAGADLDGNGLIDFAVSTKDDGLVVYYQRRPGEWERGWGYMQEKTTQWRGAVLAEDLDGDGRADLALLAEKALLLFLQRKDGHFHPVSRYPLADPDNYDLMSADINRDGRKDLLYITRKSRYALRVRLQDELGGYAVERLLRLDTPRSTPALLEQGNRVELAWIDSATGLIEVAGINLGSIGVDQDPIPQVHALPVRVRNTSIYGVGDLDGDGEQEVILADPKASQLWIYKNRGNAVFSEPVAYPVFSGVTSVALGDADGDGRMEVYLASSKESVVGVSQLQANGRLSYPHPILLEQKPLALAFVPATPSQSAQLAIVLRTKKKRLLHLLTPTAEGWRKSAVLPLEGLSTDPNGILSADWNQDGQPDLMLFTPRSPARLLLGDGNGGFHHLSTREGFRAALFDGATPGDVTLADPDGDGELEVLVNGDGFVRSLRIEDGIQVEDQFNLNDPTARASSALLHDMDGDGSPELLLTAGGDDKLEVQRRNDSGLFRPWRTHTIGSIELLATQRLPQSDGGSALLYLGQDRFWVIKQASANLYLKKLVSHESDLEKVKYGELAYGDLNADGVHELIAQDDRETRILEVLQRHNSALQRKLHFAVFNDLEGQDQPFGTHEPRELLVTDIDGDGMDDVILLVHDRLLIYLAGNP